MPRSHVGTAPIIASILTAALLASVRKLGHREAKSHPESVAGAGPRTHMLHHHTSLPLAFPPAPSRTCVFIVPYQLFCCQEHVCCGCSLLWRIRASYCSLARKCQQFSSLITKFHSSQLAGPLLAVKMNSDLFRCGVIYGF